MNFERDTMEWQGVKYPVIALTIFEGIPQAEDNILVGSTELENKLIDDNGTPFDSVCEAVDDEFGFYLTPDEMNLPNKEIIKLIEENYY